MGSENVEKVRHRLGGMKDHDPETQAEHSYHLPCMSIDPPFRCGLGNSYELSTGEKTSQHV